MTDFEKRIAEELSECYDMSEAIDCFESNDFEFEEADVECGTPEKVELYFKYVGNEAVSENTEFSLYVYLKEETFERYYQATQDEDAADEYDEWLEAFNNLDWFTVLDDVLCIIPIYNKENTEFIPLRGSVEEQLRLQSRYEKWLENNHKE